MAFSTICTTKNCQQLQNPYLDPNTNKVYCSVCNNEIINLTPIVKNQMKQMKQFKTKSTKSFTVKCSSCGKEDQPIIKNDDVFCNLCNKPLSNLPTIFKNMLKENLSKANKDV